MLTNKRHQKHHNQHEIASKNTFFLQKPKNAIIFAPQNLSGAFLSTKPAARMVESVDTRDLKSLGHCGCVGSSPTPSTGQGTSAF